MQRPTVRRSRAARRPSVRAAQRSGAAHPGGRAARSAHGERPTAARRIRNADRLRGAAGSPWRVGAPLLARRGSPRRQSGGVRGQRRPLADPGRAADLRRRSAAGGCRGAAGARGCQPGALPSGREGSRLRLCGWASPSCSSSTASWPCGRRGSPGSNPTVPRSKRGGPPEKVCPGTCSGRRCSSAKPRPIWRTRRGSATWRDSG